LIDTKLRSATDQLTFAQSQLDAAIAAGRRGESSVDALDSASRNLTAARATMDEISRDIEATAEPAANMRDCPSCKNKIRLEATLCGYCWKKL
jgi:hypothetical protein